MDPGSLSFRNHRSHQIARLVAEMHFFPLPVANGKAVLICAAHLPLAVSSRFNPQRDHPECVKLFGRAFADVGRIEPVRFRQASLDAVIFGLPPTVLPSRGRPRFFSRS
jgi:hypothetical protein